MGNFVVGRDITVFIMTGDFLKAIDERCGTTHNYTALSIFSSSSSGALMLLTIPLNSIIIYTILKERNKKYSSLFYKLLLNIAVADLLTGLIADPSAVNALTKEAMRIKLKLVEVYIIHVSLFFTDAVALLTLSILSIDRIIALVYPTKHYKGVSKRAGLAIVLGVWPSAFLLVVPYFKINFIRQLLVFSTVNIVVTILSLIFTTITYKRNLKNISFEKAKQFSDSNINMDEIKECNNSIGDLSKKQQPPNQKTNVKISNKQIRSQHKATRTFLLMLVVFVSTYLPTAITMIYMNVCTTCNCLTIHIMRDISILSILSSSVFRSLNFILTLRHLRASVKGMFKREKEQQNVSSTSGVTAQY